MSNSVNHAQDGEPADETSAPRAVVHKKILEAAEEQPDASFTELADAVSGASEELVERVLEEYGDPAEGEDDDPEQSDAADGGDDASTPPMKPNETVSTPDAGPSDDADPDLEQVTERQERVLRAIHERPDATQAQLADEFDVSAATINQRVNAIDGFDWSRRRDLVNSLFDDAEFEGYAESQPAGSESETDASRPQSESRTGSDAAEPDSDALEPSSDVSGPDSPAPEAETGTADPKPEATEPESDASEPRSDSSGPEANGIELEASAPEPESAGSEVRATGEPPSEAVEGLTEQVGDLAERVAALEVRVEDRPGAGGALSDPDLVSKMVHACMESERVTEEEELRILRAVLTSAEASGA